MFQDKFFHHNNFHLRQKDLTTPSTIDENNPFTLNNIQSSKNHTFVFKLPLLGNYYNEQESASDKFTNVKLIMYNNNTPQVSYNVPKTQTSYTDNNSNGKPTKIKISFDLKKADASVIYNSEDTTEWNIEFSAKDQLGRDVKKTWSNVFNIHKDKPKFVSLEIKVEKETNPPTYTLPLYGKTDKITIVGTVNKSLKNTTGTSPQLKLNINDINDNSVYAKTTSTTTTTNTTTITFEYTVQSGDYIDKNNPEFLKILDIIDYDGLQDDYGNTIDETSVTDLGKDLSIEKLPNNATLSSPYPFLKLNTSGTYIDQIVTHGYVDAIDPTITVSVADNTNYVTVESKKYLKKDASLYLQVTFNKSMIHGKITLANNFNATITVDVNSDATTYIVSVPYDNIDNISDELKITGFKGTLTDHFDHPLTWSQDLDTQIYVDKTLPTITIISQVQSSNNNKPSITVTSSKDVTLDIIPSSLSFTTTKLYTNKETTLTFSKELSDGTYSTSTNPIKIQAIDLVGNPSTSIKLEEFVVHTIPPDPPIVKIIVPGQTTKKVDWSHTGKEIVANNIFTNNQNAINVEYAKHDDERPDAKSWQWREAGYDSSNSIKWIDGADDLIIKIDKEFVFKNAIKYNHIEVRSKDKFGNYSAINIQPKDVVIHFDFTPPKPINNQYPSFSTLQEVLYIGFKEKVTSDERVQPPWQQHRLRMS